MVANKTPAEANHWLLGWKREFRKNWVLYVMSLIPVSFLFVFAYMPMYGVQIAFKDYKLLSGFSGSTWVGLKHFSNFLQSPDFFGVLTNTISLSLYNLILFPLPIVLALSLTYVTSGKFRKTVQMITYIPHFLSVIVVCGMVIMFLDVHYGFIPAAMGLIGVDTGDLMASPRVFKHIMAWSNVWQNLGYSSILYVATLASVSPELHEAAIIDGASIWQRIWHVDLPGILPTVCLLLVMSIGNILNNDFERVLLLQNFLNQSKSEVITTYVYKLSFANTLPQYSYSSAVNLFTTIINIIMLFLANTVTNKINGMGLW